jgi:hypothetical protein
LETFENNPSDVVLDAGRGVAEDGGAAREWALIFEVVACRNIKALLPGRSY